MAESFVHLHTHTEYSMLDGAARVNDAVAAAAADGQPAMGITDHGNMYGVLDFYRACRDHGLTPVIGTEAYMAAEHRRERPARRTKATRSEAAHDSGTKHNFHLTLLAENNTGYKNLIQVASRAFLEGYYVKPRVDWEVLADHSAGVIATTGCLGGQVCQALLRGEPDQGLQIAGRLQDIFGRDNLFVELQNHGLGEQQRTNPQLIDIARQLGAPLLATNDSHYVHRHDAVAHDALLCVQTASLMSDRNRFRFQSDEHYVKTAAEMRAVFSEVPEACDNTLWIAQRSEVEITFGKPQLPQFPLPEGFDTDRDYLEHLCFEGARRRWGAALSDEIVDRLVYELRVIAEMGFSSYFLIVGDLIAHARSHDIRVGPGRGSAAGCAVAYCLEITDLDPLRYGLLFERFLNPSRVSMPDIDMDFDSRHRDDMIRYAAQRYGRDHVAQIVTFSQIKARAAVRDAARVLGKPYALGDKISKLMPELIMGRDTPLRACLEPDPRHRDGYKMAAELRSLLAADPEAAQVVEVAKGLEGLRRQDGIHAAAVVITEEPLTEYMPIQRKPAAGHPAEEAPVVTQFEMHDVEALGLLKMDFLGLRNLDVITDTVNTVCATTGQPFRIEDAPLDDEATYEMLRRGDTIGVFQLEGAQMRSLMRSLAPTSFDDVAALVALYRPGPMAVNMHRDYADRKNGRKPVEYFHPDAEALLGDTWGLCIYQEQVMRIAQHFAGYTLGEADTLRKAAGKKSRELMAAERVRFEAGVQAAGYGTRMGPELFNMIEHFADYAFNRSHSYAYALIAYQTAYLKANHPAAYMAALLSSVRANIDKAATYLAECARMGLRVSPPDINRSGGAFRADPHDATRVLFGLAAVRNVGDQVVDTIVAQRDSTGPFESFDDFCSRVEPSVLNKKVMESLCAAGAFECFGHPRKGLLSVLPAALSRHSTARKRAAAGILSLFDDPDTAGGAGEHTMVPDEEFTKAELLAAERDLLGLYVSGHPLSGAVEEMAAEVDWLSSELGDNAEAGWVRTGGVIANLATRRTRRGEQMATCRLEDPGGGVDMFVFAKTMARCGTLLRNDTPVIVEGRYEPAGDPPRLVAHRVESFVAEDPETLVVDVTSRQAAQSDLLAAVADTLMEHPGRQRVAVRVNGSLTVRLALRAANTPACAQQLKALLT